MRLVSVDLDRITVIYTRIFGFHYSHLFLSLFFTLALPVKIKTKQISVKWVTSLCAKLGSWPLAACSHCVQFHHNILLAAAPTLLPSLAEHSNKLF